MTNRPIWLTEPLNPLTQVFLMYLPRRSSDILGMSLNWNALTDTIAL